MRVNKPSKDIHIGDIFEVSTSEGFFYIQYCNFDNSMGYLLRKLEGKFEVPEFDAKKLTIINTAYYFFYPLAAAIRQKCVKLVGRGELPAVDKAMPVMTNPIHEIVKGPGKPPLWEIIDPVNGIYKLSKLNEAQKKLSIQSILSHRSLEIYLINDWTPYKAHTNYEKFGTTWIKPDKL
jgi:hypothetical protein